MEALSTEDNYLGLIYDLKDDIAERKDLAADNPERVSQLRELLEEWEQDKIDPLWQEGDRYKVMRYQYHTQRFKTGERLKEAEASTAGRNIDTVTFVWMQGDKDG